MIRYANLHLHDRWPHGAKWDQRHIYRMLDRVGAVESSIAEISARGGVVVFAAGDHLDYAPAVQRLVDLSPGLVLIATSDEKSQFNWSAIDFGQSDRKKLWVQLPRVDRAYPPGTRFFGEMSPSTGGPTLLKASARRHTLHFAGQVQNGRRYQCVRAINRLNLPNQICRITPGFLQGVAPEQYVAELNESMFVACPSGTATQSTFRAFEALEHGCIPIVDMVNPLDGSTGYWDKIGMPWLPQILDWSTLGGVIERLQIQGIDTVQADMMKRWAAYKAEMLGNLRLDASAAVREAYS